MAVRILAGAVALLVFILPLWSGPLGHSLSLDPSASRWLGRGAAAVMVVVVVVACRLGARPTATAPS